MRITGLLFTIAAFLLLAPPASAATVELQNGTLRYVAGPGERNQVSVTKWIVNKPGDMSGTDVDDSGAQIAPGPGCTGNGRGSAHCDGPISRIEIVLGDDNDWAQAGPEDRTDQNIAVEVHGGEGDDQIRGGHTTSALYGDDGDDALHGGAGNDTLNGGPGQDDLMAGPGDDKVYGGDGVDIGWGGPGSDRLEGGEGLDELFGWDSWASSQATLPDGNDTLIGGGGPDYLDGEPGSDEISGGEGIDQLRYLGRPEPLTVTLDGVGGDGAPGENDLVHGDIENLVGGRGNDVLIGNGLANNIDGFAGDDRIVGGSGRDQLLGDEGNDAIDAREPADGPPVGSEHVDCGAGDDDGAELDGDDYPLGCERTARNGRPAGEKPADPATDEPALVLQKPSVSVRRGALTFRLTCKSRRSRCRGLATTTATGRVSLARRSFTVKSGRPQRVQLELTSRGRKLVARRGKLRARVTVRLTEPGAPPAVWTRTIVIRRGSL